MHSAHQRAVTYTLSYLQYWEHSRRDKTLTKREFAVSWVGCRNPPLSPSPQYCVQLITLARVIFNYALLYSKDT